MVQDFRHWTQAQVDQWNANIRKARHMPAVEPQLAVDEASPPRLTHTLLISEKSFLEQVRRISEVFGWLYYHTYRSTSSAAGFPDVVLVRGDRLIFAELKSEAGKLTESQVVWLEALRHTGAEVYLWRPSDFEQVERVLR